MYFYRLYSVSTFFYGGSSVLPSFFVLSLGFFGAVKYGGFLLRKNISNPMRAMFLAAFLSRLTVSIEQRLSPHRINL
jgi:hypothetical protein